MINQLQMKTLCHGMILAFIAWGSVSIALAQSPATTPNAQPEKLVIEVEVPAPVSEVWRAFSTREGLITWLTPDAVVDLRPGGDWICRFPGGSTGGGTIVSLVPEKKLVVAALAPDNFPHVRAERTRAVFQFEPRGGSTIVRLIQTGWKSGDEWTRAYEYLVAGNAQLMSSLHKRFVEGPVDWKKVFGEAAKGK
jgi:uncharacterized protein YndB with AHSA1/START domain